MKEIKDGTPETRSHWKHLSDGKPILCVDFHHVITMDCEACKDGNRNYTVQKGVKEALISLRKTFRIVIYTGNPSGMSWLKNHLYKGGIDGIFGYKAHMKWWLKQHEIPFDDIIFTKPPACFLIDDRAIHHTSWANTLSEINRRMHL